MSTNRRRLVAGSSSRRAHGSHAADSATSISLDLPPYEPPACPLHEEGKKALKELSMSRMNENIKKHLDESKRLLPAAVYESLETISIRKRQAASAKEREAKRRRANGDDNELEDKAMLAEQRVKELEERVSPLTIRLEMSMRQVLDMEATLQDEKRILVDLPRLLAQAQDAVTAEHTSQSQEADGDPPEIPGVPILQILETERGKRGAVYDKLSLQAKYAQHNAYIDFKRSWHDGLCYDQDAGLPVPDPSTWFGEDGHPQHLIGRQADEETDDDIQIASEKKSFLCPLSLTQMTEPYTSRSCNHSFQKKNILEYLNGKRGPAPCPQSGCDQVGLTPKDFFFDQSLLRQIKRAQQAAENADSSDDDDSMREQTLDQEGVDGEHDVMEVGSDMQLKNEQVDDDA